MEGIIVAVAIIIDLPCLHLYDYIVSSPSSEHANPVSNDH